MQNIQVLTSEDLIKWKDDIITEFHNILKNAQSEQFLKSNQVKKLLHCSDSTLQKHRIYGRLPFRKLGGTYYYKLSDVNKMLNTFQNYN